MRKTIIIASIILVIVLVIIFIVFARRNQPLDTNNQSPIVPTNVVNETANVNQGTINNALALAPYEDENFRFDYSTDLNQLVVEEKTPLAREKFTDWATQNGLTELAANPELVVFENQSGEVITVSPTPAFDPIIEFLNIFLNFGQGAGTTESTPAPTSSLQSPSPSPISNSQSPTSGFTYYAQCDSEYSSLTLPGGCNLCQAGCGPSVVAMIAASYLGSNFNPQTVVNLYQSRGYELSCAGSNYADAKSLLQSLGLRTTDYLIFNYETADQVLPDLRRYLSSGWTFFTLASFKDVGGGHFFWITDIDEAGNIFAYDPYYGRFEAPPINENSRYPFPKYRLAFGVKK